MPSASRWPGKAKSIAAEESFRKAIQINPRLYEAHLGLASVLQQTGDLTGRL